MEYASHVLWLCRTVGLSSIPHKTKNWTYVECVVRDLAFYNACGLKESRVLSPFEPSWYTRTSNSGSKCGGYRSHVPKSLVFADQFIVDLCSVHISSSLAKHL